MPRMLPVALAVLLLAAAPSLAWSQDFGAFPDYPDVTPETVTKLPLGPGYYLSLLKIAGCWLLFLLWAHTVDWINRDGQQLKLEYRRWNMGAFFPFLGAIVVLWAAPWFWLAFPLMFLAWLVPLVAYTVHRNGQVAVGETVLTPDHIRFWLSEKLAYVGIKIAAEGGRRGAPPPVELEARGGGNDRTNAAHLLLARQSAGFALVQELLAESRERRGDAILMDFTPEAVAMRLQIDGVWHDTDPRDRESGDAMLAVMKVLAALDPKQRVTRQEGAYGATYQKTKYTCRLVSQGTKTGERALLQVQPDKGKGPGKRLADLDIRQKLLDDLKVCLDSPRGLILVSAPPGGGLSTLFSATVASMDRFVRSFVAIESTAQRELEVENIPVTTYEAGKGPMSILPKLIREHPDVFVISDLVDAETGTILCDQVEEEHRLVVTSIRAKEAAESLLRVLMLKVPAAKFAPAVTAALNQRLIRKLCPTCKEAYAPSPQVLEQLGIPAGRVEALYRPPQQPEEVCADCGGIGYLGRTAMFELLIVDDNMRQALQKTPQLAAVRQAARRAGMRTLQEEGIVLVAKGITSLPELMRVLKE